MFSTQRVKAIAHLARLNLSETEICDLQKDLDAITSWINCLETLDSQDAPCPKTQILQDDHPETLKQCPKDLLKNAPDARKDYLAVPLILE